MAHEDKEFLNQNEAAEVVGVHPNTLVAFSKRKDGPPRSKLSPRLIRYRRADLLAWMESRTERREEAA
jgi:predicted DNA-binding transcriptional regulator AlpA